jgi:hypothetical protein
VTMASGIDYFLAFRRRAPEPVRVRARAGASEPAAKRVAP